MTMLEMQFYQTLENMKDMEFRVYSKGVVSMLVITLSDIVGIILMAIAIPVCTALYVKDKIKKRKRKEGESNR